MVDEQFSQNYHLFVHLNAVRLEMGTTPNSTVDEGRYKIETLMFTMSGITLILFLIAAFLIIKVYNLLKFNDIPQLLSIICICCSMGSKIISKCLN
jgi:hypothetical protein